MRAESDWTPGKYALTPRGLRASNDTSEVFVGSRLAADYAARAISTALEHHARGDLLDLGAGSVPFYGTYRPFVDNITCIDWPGSLHLTSHLDLVANANIGLPFADSSFDTVLSTSVFEHLHSPDIAWDEVARVLRPGGIFILEVPFMYWIHEQPHDYFRYTEYALRRFSAQCGLKMLSLESTGSGLIALADMAAKVFGAVPTLARLFVWCCRHLFDSCIGRYFAEDPRSQRFPLGYCAVAQKPPGPART